MNINRQKKEKKIESVFCVCRFAFNNHNLAENKEEDRGEEKKRRQCRGVVRVMVRSVVKVYKCSTSIQV